MDRHPVSWFQSLYNFRVQNLEGLPHPNKLVGRCMSGMKNTCTEKGNFAYDLMRMGKRNLANGPQPTTDLEEQILGRYRRAWYNATEVPPMANEVFFFDISQLADTNATRTQRFRDDVREFLGLDGDLPPFVHVVPGREHNATIQALKDRNKINICDDEFAPVRTELMRLGRLNSQWMREVFLNMPGVRSSREYLEELLLGWMNDPCEKDGVTSIS